MTPLRPAPYQWMALGAAAVLVVGAVIFLLARSPGAHPDPSVVDDRLSIPPTAVNAETAPATIDRLAQNKSSAWHWLNLLGMASSMRDAGYAVSVDSLDYDISGVADRLGTWPCTVFWWLDGLGSPAPHDVPVCYLQVVHGGPFIDKMTGAVIKEFDRMGPGGDIRKTTEAMKQAQGAFDQIRQRPPNGQDPLGRFLWHAQSPLPERIQTDSPLGGYIYRVDIKEWPPGDYPAGEGLSQVVVWFVYIPPDRQIMLWEIPDLSDWVAAHEPVPPP